MKKIEVFDGNALHELPVEYPVGPARCVLCGQDSSKNRTYVRLDEELLSRHMMLLGGIGTGKTNAFYQIISQLRKGMTEQDIMIVFDTKGDFYQSFYQPGDVVISNDATACGPDGPDYWNIFNELELGEDMEVAINEISTTLFAQRLKNTTQPFFPNAAKDLFGAVLTHFSRNRGDFYCDNQALRQFMDAMPTAQLRKMLGQHPDLRAMTSYIYDDSSGQTQGVLSELQQQVRELFIGNFKKQGTLSMRELVRQKGGRMIFVEYDLSVGETLTPVYTLLFDLAIKEALGRKKSEGNVFFIVDEFRLLPNLTHIDDAVNFGRSIGVKFMIGLQNIEQMYEVYGEYRARSILSGFLTSVCFRVNDYASVEYIQQLHGHNRKKEVYMASVQGRGIIEEVRDANVVEDWDIQRLKIGEAIIGLPGKEPFRFHFLRAK